MNARTTISLSVFLLFTTLTAFSQRVITAKVVDKETKKPVKDALITIEGTEITTTTNVSGYFQLTIDSIRNLVIESSEYDPSLVTVPEANNFMIALVKTPIVMENLVNKADDEDKIFMIVEEQAEFTGGLSALAKFISKNLNYPMQARRMGIEGQVFVTIQVEDAQADFERLQKAGLKISYPLKDEPWGQRRFGVIDPNGMYVDVVQQIEPAPGFWEKYPAADR